MGKNAPDPEDVASDRHAHEESKLDDVEAEENQVQKNGPGEIGYSVKENHKIAERGHQDASVIDRWDKMTKDDEVIDLVAHEEMSSEVANTNFEGNTGFIDLRSTGMLTDRVQCSLHDTYAESNTFVDIRGSVKHVNREKSAAHGIISDEEENWQDDEEELVNLDRILEHGRINLVEEDPEWTSDDEELANLDKILRIARVDEIMDQKEHVNLLEEAQDWLSDGEELVNIDELIGIVDVDETIATYDEVLVESRLDEPYDLPGDDGKCVDLGFHKEPTGIKGRNVEDNHFVSNENSAKHAVENLLQGTLRGLNDDDHDDLINIDEVQETSHADEDTANKNDTHAFENSLNEPHNSSSEESQLVHVVVVHEAPSVLEEPKVGHISAADFENDATYVADEQDVGQDIASGYETLEKMIFFLTVTQPETPSTKSTICRMTIES